jgi:hypothetical protein
VKLLASLMLLLSCQGCQKDKAHDPAPAPSASAVAAAPSASAAPAAAWFEGSWQGTYKAELHRIETAAGGVKEWKKDEGAQASGEGKLSLEAKPDGTVSGQASGALGEQTVSGRIEGEHVALKLTPTDANGFQGTILGSGAAEGINGALSASTGDSLVVRKAAVTLVKAAK